MGRGDTSTRARPRAPRRAARETESETRERDREPRARETHLEMTYSLLDAHGHKVSGVGLGETRLWGSVSAHKSCFVYTVKRTSIKYGT